MNVLIAGCGYTGRRVAKLLAAKGANVTATTRDPSMLDIAGVKIVEYRAGSMRRLEITEATRVLHSLPAIMGSDPTPALLKAFTATPARIVYLSTTGVYGNATIVNEDTPVDPSFERAQNRLAAEAACQAGPWSSMILRPAAIYGPGRGAHAAMRAGQFYLVGDGSNYVSRIHVDDLAAHAESALISDLTGAWPVADELPCTSREIAEFCSRLLGIDMPPSIPADEAHETRTANRRVDGSAIRKLLGIQLRYPTYREGIRASL